MSQIIESASKGVRIIQLNPENKRNFFNPALEDALKTALKRADNDSAVRAVVVHGGGDRSFCDGNDFSQLENLFGYRGVDEWIERAIDVYATVLEMEKPSVAAIGGNAAGIGFQFAMMFDWRIMSLDATLHMQNLRHGIGCSTGAVILEHVASWNIMRDIIYRAEGIAAAQALQYGLINDAVDGIALLDRAIEAASALAGYPRIAFRNTKRVINHGFLLRLMEASAVSKRVHRSTFAEQGVSPGFHPMNRERGGDISSGFTAI
jgi:carboxymethylproline synthase